MLFSFLSILSVNLWSQRFYLLVTISESWEAWKQAALQMPWPLGGMLGRVGKGACTSCSWCKGRNNWEGTRVFFKDNFAFWSRLLTRSVMSKRTQVGFLLPTSAYSPIPSSKGHPCPGDLPTTQGKLFPGHLANALFFHSWRQGNSPYLALSDTPENKHKPNHRLHSTLSALIQTFEICFCL